MTSLVQITVVSLANLHKRPEVLARYYVTSYWQAEWVKKLRWKTIELTSPPLPPDSTLKISCCIFWSNTDHKGLYFHLYLYHQFSFALQTES